MTTAYMDAIHEAILDGADGEVLGELPLPATMRAAVVRREDEDVFAGVPSAEKDPSRTLRVEEVPLPPLGAGEVLIAPMASAINYNTVWTSLFEPVSSRCRGRRRGSSTHKSGR